MFGFDPIKGVTRWFKQLAWGRVNAAKASARGKLYGQQAKMKSKVAGEFNKGVDGALKKSKSKVMGKGAKGAKGEKGAKGGQSAKGGKGSNAPKKQDGKMGLFGRKDKGNESSPGGGPDPQHVEPEEHTIALSVDEQSDEFRECVGWVVVRNGPSKGRDFRLVPGKNVLGTTADCDVVVTDPYLSNKHCVLRFEDGEFTVVDLDSTNGTFVNNNRIVKTSLVDNDSIRVGRTELKFKALE